MRWTFMKTIIYMYNKYKRLRLSHYTLKQSNILTSTVICFNHSSIHTIRIIYYTRIQYTTLLDSFILLVVIRRTVIFIYFNNSYANAESLVM